MFLTSNCTLRIIIQPQNYLLNIDPTLYAIYIRIVK